MSAHGGCVRQVQRCALVGFGFRALRTDVSWKRQSESLVAKGDQPRFVESLELFLVLRRIDVYR